MGHDDGFSGIGGGGDGSGAEWDTSRFCGVLSAYPLRVKLGVIEQVVGFFTTDYRRACESLHSLGALTWTLEVTGSAFALPQPEGCTAVERTLALYEVWVTDWWRRPPAVAENFELVTKEMVLHVGVLFRCERSTLSAALCGKALAFLSMLADRATPRYRLGTPVLVHSLRRTPQMSRVERLNGQRGEVIGHADDGRILVQFAAAAATQAASATARSRSPSPPDGAVGGGCCVPLPAFASSSSAAAPTGASLGASASLGGSLPCHNRSSNSLVQSWGTASLPNTPGSTTAGLAATLPQFSDADPPTPPPQPQPDQQVHTTPHPSVLAIAKACVSEDADALAPTAEEAPLPAGNWEALIKTLVGVGDVLLGDEGRGASQSPSLADYAAARSSAAAGAAEETHVTVAYMLLSCLFRVLLALDLEREGLWQAAHERVGRWRGSMVFVRQWGAVAKGLAVSLRRVLYADAAAAAAAALKSPRRSDDEDEGDEAGGTGPSRMTVAVSWRGACALSQPQKIVVDGASVFPLWRRILAMLLDNINLIPADREGVHYEASACVRVVFLLVARAGWWTEQQSDPAAGRVSAPYIPDPSPTCSSVFALFREYLLRSVFDAAPAAAATTPAEKQKRQPYNRNIFSVQCLGDLFLQALQRGGEDAMRAADVRLFFCAVSKLLGGAKPGGGGEAAAARFVTLSGGRTPTQRLTAEGVFHLTLVRSLRLVFCCDLPQVGSLCPLFLRYFTAVLGYQGDGGSGAASASASAHDLATLIAALPIQVNPPPGEASEAEVAVVAAASTTTTAGRQRPPPLLAAASSNSLGVAAGRGGVSAPVRSTHDGSVSRPVSSCSFTSSPACDSEDEDEDVPASAKEAFYIPMRRVAVQMLGGLAGRALKMTREQRPGRVPAAGCDETAATLDCLLQILYEEKDPKVLSECIMVCVLVVNIVMRSDGGAKDAVFARVVEQIAQVTEGRHTPCVYFACLEFFRSAVLPFSCRGGAAAATGAPPLHRAMRAASTFVRALSTRSQYAQRFSTSNAAAAAALGESAILPPRVSFTHLTRSEVDDLCAASLAFLKEGVASLGARALYGEHKALLAGIREVVDLTRGPAASPMLQSASLSLAHFLLAAPQDGGGVAAPPAPTLTEASFETCPSVKAMTRFFSLDSNKILTLISHEGKADKGPSGGAGVTMIRRDSYGRHVWQFRLLLETPQEGAGGGGGGGTSADASMATVASMTGSSPSPPASPKEAGAEVGDSGRRGSGGGGDNGDDNDNGNDNDNEQAAATDAASAAAAAVPPQSAHSDAGDSPRSTQHTADLDNDNTDTETADSPRRAEAAGVSALPASAPAAAGSLNAILSNLIRLEMSSQDHALTDTKADNVAASSADNAQLSTGDDRPSSNHNDAVACDEACAAPLPHAVVTPESLARAAAAAAAAAASEGCGGCGGGAEAGAEQARLLLASLQFLPTLKRATQPEAPRSTGTRSRLSELRDTPRLRSALHMVDATPPRELFRILTVYVHGEAGAARLSDMGLEWYTAAVLDSTAGTQARAGDELPTLRSFVSFVSGMGGPMDAGEFPERYHGGHAVGEKYRRRKLHYYEDVLTETALPVFAATRSVLRSGSAPWDVGGGGGQKQAWEDASPVRIVWNDTPTEYNPTSCPDSAAVEQLAQHLPGFAPNLSKTLDIVITPLRDGLCAIRIILPLANDRYAHKKTIQEERNTQCVQTLPTCKPLPHRWYGLLPASAFQPSEWHAPLLDGMVRPSALSFSDLSIRQIHGKHYAAQMHQHTNDTHRRLCRSPCCRPSLVLQLSMPAVPSAASGRSRLRKL